MNEPDMCRIFNIRHISGMRKKSEWYSMPLRLGIGGANLMRGVLKTPLIGKSCVI